MLHTLLPPIERKSLRHEYRLRTLTVLLFTLSVAGVIGIGSLFPAFIRAMTERAAAEQELALIKKQKDLSGLTAIQQQVAIGQKLVALLSLNSGRALLSSVVENLTQDRGQVRISSLAVDYISTTTAEATIQGVAPTRDVLLSFKSRLENDNPGSKVELPVSELAKSINIPFSVKISLNLP